MRLSLLALVLLLSSAASADSKSDEAAVLELPRAFADAFSKHDGRALAKLVADDVDFVTVGALWLHGKSDFERYHVRLLEGRFKDSSNRVLESKVRWLRPDLAVVHWTWAIEGDKNLDGTPRPKRYGMMSLVAEKRQGRWLIVVGQNTNNTLGSAPEAEGIKAPLVTPSPEPAPATHPAGRG